MTRAASTPAITPTRAPLLPELAGLRRPRLRETTPVLWRDATTIAIGDRVVVAQVDRAAANWLVSLDGLREPAAIEADLPIEPDQARRLLRAAVAAAALDDAAVVPDAIRWADASGRQTAWGRYGAAVETAGSVADGLAAFAAREAARVAVVGVGPLAEQVRAAVALAGLRPTAGPATVTIVADLPHPDLTPASDIEPDGPYVPVAVWGRRAVAGPVTVPGRSGCLRCAQLHRRDADPAWPLLAVQWAHAVAAVASPPVDPLLASLAAAHAVQLARRWIDDPGPDTVGQAIELTLPEATAVVRHRPLHPLCGCRWAGVDR